eukprot:GHRQ01009441.1.p3 GENE.GHRQ01009441.1~~GHRQ01009441.1.p3  ORF type:complete len:101 (-),score=17.51 GHRQ01009441.1:378-680(-)
MHGLQMSPGAEAQSRSPVMLDLLPELPMVLAGEAMGRYVPQTVLSKDGSVLDVDLVLSEAVLDQDEVLVEYSDGPTAFGTRCACMHCNSELSCNSRLAVA